MKQINTLFAVAFASAALFSSCSSDDDDNDLPKGDYDYGTLVLNEGAFTKNNASISFINAADELTNDIYSTKNGETLGDVAQSMAFEDDKAYIAINNSNVVKVVDRYTMMDITTISEGIYTPRYIVFEDDKGYVSNWGDPNDSTDDFIAVINSSTNTVEITISVAEGPEALVEEDGKLYVAHKGGYGFGNTISVINLANNTVETTITVADIPDTMEEEDGYLYVLSSGKYDWFTGEETPGAITKINMSDNSVAEVLDFEVGVHPSHLKIEDDIVYYTLGTEVYTKGLNAALPTTALIDVASQGAFGIYGFEVEDNIIYIGDAKDYASAGAVYTYNTSGTYLNSFTTGISPNGFYFND
ncbi:putative surface layer protein [Formosa agariphila KMM 3901]|uniref:Putative surface layer protein n=1 Tax=Formosa agariphila (strain DSM 15362 / KCTC 12365 / LMG 23005 / KMM 3901 / M-2Alg 35-1) TaxID=1347342 RepID=T2KMV3_FORAG|nr:DUF5074 domain-containing protein [Formosa agariphila]CDF79761.1 putative surface layer protein [Formosa agariphila KMM 3901]